MSMLNSQTKWGRNVGLIKIIFDNRGRLTVLGERNVLQSCSILSIVCTYIFFFTFQRQIFVNLLIRSGVTKHIKIMNFCLKKLGNYEPLYVGSAGIISNGTLRKAQQNTRMNYRNCVRSSECRIWRFRGSNFQTFFGGSMPQDPPV